MVGASLDLAPDLRRYGSQFPRLGGCLGWVAGVTGWLAGWIGWLAAARSPKGSHGGDKPGLVGGLRITNQLVGGCV